MSTEKKPRPNRQNVPVALRRGERVVWPRGVEEAYGIKPVTRWRWERDGRLPKRDVNLGGKTGWRPETLAKAESTAA